MADSAFPLARVDAVAQAMRAGDTLTFDCDVVFNGTATGVSASHITDGTGDAGFLSTAGIWGSSGITDLTMQGSGDTAFGSTGSGTADFRSNAGATTWGSGTGWLQISGGSLTSSSNIYDITLTATDGNAQLGTVTGNSVSLTDATGTLAIGNSGSGSGDLTTSGLQSASIVLSGSGNLNVLANTGAATFGNDNATLGFSGPGALSLSGVTDLTLTNSGAATFGSVGGGTTTIQDQVGSVVLSGSGGLSTSSLTTVAISGSGNSSFGTTSTGTLSLRSATGTSRWGDGTGYLQFGGSGALTGSGLTTVTIAGGSGSNVSYTATGSGTFTSRSATGTYTLGDGTGTFVFSGSGGFSTSGLTTFAVTGGSGSGVSMSATGSGTLSLRSATGSATFGDGTGTAVFGGSGQLSTSGVTTMDLDAANNVQINSSGGTIQIGNDNVNQNIDIATAGNRTLTLGNSSGRINLGTSELMAQGTNAATLNRRFSETAGSALSVGHIVRFAATSGKLVKVAATDGAAAEKAIGACIRAAAADGDPSGYAYLDYVPMVFASAPAASDIGSVVYLSETSGEVTLDVSGFSAGSAILPLGKLRDANGSDTTCRVLWQPGTMLIA